MTRLRYLLEKQFDATRRAWRRHQAPEVRGRRRQRWGSVGYEESDKTSPAALAVRHMRTLIACALLHPDLRNSGLTRSGAGPR